MHVWRLDPRDGVITRLTHADGVHSAAGRARISLCVLPLAPRRAGPPDGPAQGGRADPHVRELAETPSLRTSPAFVVAGPRADLPARSWPHAPGHRVRAPSPVLLDPYGGPGHRRVVRTSRAHLVAQWFADQGFVVLIADGRGVRRIAARTGSESIRGDYRHPALETRSRRCTPPRPADPDLDLARWRCAAGLWRRPGRWPAAAAARRLPRRHRRRTRHRHRLYDTHYMERYLGHPAQEPDNYERCSLIHDAPNLRRPPADPRARGRQRGRGSHLAAVRGVDRCRSPALRAASERGHPHDPPGGSGREPVEAGAGLPEAVARYALIYRTLAKRSKVGKGGLVITSNTFWRFWAAPAERATAGHQDLARTVARRI